MKKIVVVLSILWGLYSCEVKQTTPEFEHLKSEKNIYVSNDSTKPYMKLDLEFTYPSKFNNDTLLVNIQKIFVQAFAGDEYAARSPKGAFEAFEKDITNEALILGSELGSEVPDFSNYYQKVKTVVTDTTGNIITVKTENENYMGGAHGMYNLSYYNIDLKTGTLITEKELFKPEAQDKIAGLITKGLKEKFGDKINEVLFQVDGIQPNGNFYFNKEGIVYVFNEYDIAPYSEGLIEVLIPYAKIKEIIAPQYAEEIG